jgi:pyruvate/oxaloacetate carboxyltransferase
MIGHTFNRYHSTATPPYLHVNIYSHTHHTTTMSLEAPVIPVEVGKEAVETTTKAIEVGVGETLTEEMLYPDRAILTSTPPLGRD